MTDLFTSWRRALFLLLVAVLAGCNVDVPAPERFADDDSDAQVEDVDAAQPGTDTVGTDITSDTIGADLGEDTGTGCAAGCDDQNPCTDDTCGKTGTCEHKAVDGGSCDDGNACTSNETCSEGKCQGGKAKVCDDNNTCTADACLPAKGCTHTDDDGAVCTDNDACTQKDTCLGGKCLGVAMTCGADDCNTAKCLNGNCTAAPKIAGLKCDDGDACTSGTKCNGGGLCAGGEITDCDDKNPCTEDSCDSTAGCQHALASGTCSDGDACTVGDACSGGTCKPGTTKDCDDGNGCTSNVCNPVDGACTATPTTAPCSDGNACTTGDACDKGVCVPGTQVGCDDGNACTVDSCDASTGLCSHVAGSSACDDGNGCTIGDTCVEGVCLGGAAQQCADKDTCTSDSCDAKTGGCVHSPINGCGDLCQSAQDCKAGDVCNTVACLSGKCAFLPTSAPCDDGNACTLADTCQGGSCHAGLAKNCDDGNPCTDDACGVGPGGAKGVCLSTANTATCSDNNACTLGDACAKAACVPGAAKVCDDGNACTSDGCDVQSGSCTATANTASCDDKNPCTQGDVCQGGSCQAGAAVSCDDGNLCTNDACDQKTGKCSFTNSTAPCSDGDACTQGDGCLGGACVSGTAKVCDDGNPCTNDACDSATAACKNLPNAATCTDGDACTIGDGCTGGGCKGGAAKVCADSDTCTNDTCDSSSGNCVFKAITGCGGNCQSAGDCKDGNVCTDDACVGGKCAFPANAAACDDGNGCTQGDACAGGGCKSGSLKGCDDGNPCTTDACSPQTGACSSVANTAPCDDGNACTGGDVCGSGKCQPGKPTACNDGNVCTDDACDPTTGACKAVANTASCDDSNACTQGDVCNASACKPGAAKNCDDDNVCTNDGCDAATGTCTHVANSSPCSDNNACTLGDVCAAGTCKAGAAKSCEDGKLCTDDSCDKVSGSCVNTANTVPCDDGNKCTQGDKCGLGSCQPGTAVPCDDKDACTNDSCNPGDGQCVFAPKIGCGGNCAKAADCSDGNPCTDDQCTAGKCAFPANTAACDDANPCTVGDICASGTCKAGSPKPCDDNNACTNDSCNVASGTCAYVNNTAPCSDNDACTIGDACAAAKCVPGQPKSCSDGNGCTDDSCNPGTGSCVNANNTATCNDNNACTTSDACAGGVCKGGAAPNCDDGKPCTTDSCDPASGCKYVSNTSVCSDNNACTTGDACSGGACVGGPALACDDGKVCTSDSCDPASGCKFANNTLGCSDGNACTLSDVCSGGTCQAGAAKACNDNDNCTSDSCDPAGGACVFKPIFGCGGNCASVGDCGDGNLCTTDSCTAGKCAYANNTLACNDANACTTNDACSAGACVGGAAPNCDDNNPCTSDSCDKTKGCQNVNNTLSCNDNNACTTGDLCSGGSCLGGAAPNCDDNNACTTDSCDKVNGCTHANNTQACNDGNACTSGDVCGQGVCTGTAVNCDDKKECTADSCDKSLGCQNVNVSAGVPCDDGNVCTVGDACQGGSCKPGGLSWVDKLAGSVPNPNNGAGSGGYADGAGSKALFNTPTGLAFDSKSGALFVADTYNHMIRKLAPSGDVSTFAGYGKPGAADGVGTGASFYLPTGIAADGQGNLFVADSGNSRIRKVAGDGTVTTVVGSAGAGFADGKASTAKLLNPKGIAVSPTGVLAIADTGNHAIRLFNPQDGTLVTLGGVGVAGFADGPASKSKFDTPTGVAFDASGAVWVADQFNHRIRKVGTDGSVQTAGGDGVAGFLDNLDPTKARFNYPAALLTTIGPNGTVILIADSYNGRVRRGGGNGVTTVAGGGSLGPADGVAANVSFYLPSGIAADGSGYLYVADTYNHVIRRIRDTAGTCTIKGTCYVQGTTNPADPCQVCGNSAPDDWASKGVGGSCDDGDACTSNDACMVNNGSLTCSSKTASCDDGNLCTDDACDKVTAKCTFTANKSACNDNEVCTKGDYCDQGSCVAGGGNYCDDGNPCTTDTCGSGGACTYKSLPFGTACQGSATQAYGFCSGSTCTGLEQSALTMPTSGVSLGRLTGISRGPDGKVQVSGFGLGSSSAQSGLFTLDPTASPPSLSQLLGGNPVEYWATAYRIVTGGKATVPTVGDVSPLTAVYSAANGWQNVGGPSFPSAATRILRHVTYATDVNNNELYYAGGNVDGGSVPTTLYRFQYSASGTWSTSASGLGEMGLFNGYISTATACSSALISANIAGVYAPDSSSLWVAANSTTTPSTPYVALWNASNTMNTTCTAVAPGGSVVASTSANSWAISGSSGQVVTAVHGSSTYHALAVGYNASSQPLIWNLSATPIATESPQPTPPTGMPAFSSGAYVPTAVSVGANHAWVAGTVLYNGCNYLWLLHGTVTGATTYSWDKLLVSTSTAYACTNTAWNQLSVTRIWADPSGTGVYLTGSVAKDASGGTKVAAGTASQGQFGVVWRIK